VNAALARGKTQLLENSNLALVTASNGYGFTPLVTDGGKVFVGFLDS
jgi:hypothetical protein